MFHVHLVFNLITIWYIEPRLSVFDLKFTDFYVLLFESIPVLFLYGNYFH